MARAGAFVSIDSEGRLRVERGYVLPEDEQIVVPESASNTDTDWDSRESGDAEGIEAEQVAAMQTGSDSVSVAVGAPEPEEEDGIKPLPDRLMSELTAHRTLALRVALGEHREVAFLAALHALCLRLFYPYALDTCLELEVKSIGFNAQAPGLNDTALARMLAQRHQDWQAKLPKQPEALWDTLADLGELSREALFAHCVALSVNAVFEPYNRRPRALAHADRLAQAVGLDMAASWAPTVETYLGRVTKARILQAVREARGNEAAERIAHLKKGEMAEQAQALLDGSFWLPEPLRTPGGVVANGEESEAEHSCVEPEQQGADEPAEAWPIAAE
ncbi:MAG: hypothetical protein JOZ05_18300 [Acetobacteraceae bacterium]|nr:hypothetical protein [Acetobacteraceae bacterium]